MNAEPVHSREYDVELWQRVLNDDNKAFEDVVIKYQNLVAAVAYSGTGNFSLSEEVTQETFWQAWRQRNQLRDLNRLAPWLCGIARNLARQSSHRERRLPVEPATDQSSSSADDPAANFASEEERQLVWDCLEKIPELYREALVLFYREEHSIAEVALAVDASSDAVKQRIHRGRDMLRANLATKVEEVLVRSRPGRSLTTRVMVGFAALSASLKATSTAGAATIGTATSAAIKTAATTGAVGGVLGGLIGAVGGLGGAFLGSWLPAQLAETMVERHVLEKHGRSTFFAAVVFTLLILAATPLLFVSQGLFLYFGIIGVVTLLFIIYVVGVGLRQNKELRDVRKHLSSDAEPNLSSLRGRMGFNQSIFRGTKYTSPRKLIGIPLIDIQFADFPNVDGKSGRALGWIAIGDRATGLLFAFGGVAKGLIAMGGFALGGVAIGGGAIGIMAIGGVALGWLAFGGAAVGNEAVGGLAIAWDVATGGGAIAYHLAVGGGALAHDYAVGGGAWANEANTEVAKEMAALKSKMWMLDWIVNNHRLFLAITISIAFAPVVLMRFVYHRKIREDTDE